MKKKDQISLVRDSLASCFKGIGGKAIGLDAVQHQVAILYPFKVAGSKDSIIGRVITRLKGLVTDGGWKATKEIGSTAEADIADTIPVVVKTEEKIDGKKTGKILVNSAFPRPLNECKPSELLSYLKAQKKLDSVSDGEKDKIAKVVKWNGDRNLGLGNCPAEAIAEASHIDAKAGLYKSVGGSKITTSESRDPDGKIVRKQNIRHTYA